MAVSVAAQQVPSEGNQIVKVSQQWLDSVDRGDYDRAWLQSAGRLKTKVKQREWSLGMKAFRKKVGPLKHRYLYTLNRHPKGGGLPDTCTLYYITDYENFAVPHETVFLVHEDGSWKVAGYAAKLEGRKP